MLRNYRSLLIPLTILAAVLVPAIAFGVDPVDTTKVIAAESQKGVALGAGIAIGVAAFGCGIGQGMAALGALQGIARNPSASGKIQTPMIICLALIESLCIYALVIAFFLQGKLPSLPG
jgi:F-type H+-transporting ATPase subunit c